MLVDAGLQASPSLLELGCGGGNNAHYLKRTFAPSTEHGGHDGDGRGLRYLEWLSDADPDDCLCEVDMVYVLREDGQPLRVEHERHVHGLFLARKPG